MPATRRRGGAAAVSLAGHLTIVAALLLSHAPTSRLVEPRPMAVALVAPPPPADAAAALTQPSPSQPPPRCVARPTRNPLPDPRPQPSGDGPSSDGEAELSDAQLASAAPAGTGPVGRCDMARQLQAALRRNALVQAAVADAHRTGGESGKAMFVWNGGWVRSHGQDGNGLAAVREAIVWEIAFAPEACRAQLVHGLVLISLDDGPGAERLVVGSGAWRWSDLLGAR